jgi:hypothetical protein
VIPKKKPAEARRVGDFRANKFIRGKVGVEGVLTLSLGQANLTKYHTIFATFFVKNCTGSLTASSASLRD